MAVQKLRSSRRRKTSGNSKSKAVAPANGNGGKMKAQAHFNRYIELARAAEASGDEIQSENYYQHAEHYFRIMKEQGARA